MSSPVDGRLDPLLDSPNMPESPIHGNDKEASLVACSAEDSLPGSRGGKSPGKKRVGFTSGADSSETSRRVSWVGPATKAFTPLSTTPPFASPGESGYNTPSHSRNGSGDNMIPVDRSHLPELSPQQTRELHQALNRSLPTPRPRPAIRQTASAQSPSAIEDDGLDASDYDGQREHRRARAQDAFERGKLLEKDQRSSPTSRLTSPQRALEAGAKDRDVADIPLQELKHRSEGYDGAESDSDEGLELPKMNRERQDPHAEAKRLVRQHTVGHGHFRHENTSHASGVRSGVVTPTEEQDFAEDYKPRPKYYREGILGALLNLNGQQHHGQRTPRQHSRRNSAEISGFSANPTPQPSPSDSGATTPLTSHWFSKKGKNPSSSSLVQLVGSGASLGSPLVSGLGEQVSSKLREHKERQKHERLGLGKRTKSAGVNALHRFSRPRMEEEARITVHIAETMARQNYLVRLCRALMQYGAPTHRLEEYMNMSARVLEIRAQFLYIPGSMIMSFDDPNTHTTEVKLVRVSQGLDLGKLRDVHEIYKDVVHDRIGVEEATQRLKDVIKRPVKFSRWIRIPIYGLAALSVGPFAFGARLIDLPIAFVLGCILGILQLYVAPKSDLYANVFEIAATVITSFLARAFGSIPYGNDGKRLFCFSALAQSSIALILPGYIVLCASLELQSRSIVAGSIRMVYAIVYSLLLGFGITIGTAIYGIIDQHATSATSCDDPIPAYWFFFFVPLFTLCLIIINQAKWKQAPIMLVIAFVGYIVNYFSAQRFAGNTQVSNTLGALAIGVLANLHSRLGSKMENFLLDVWEDRLRPQWKAFRKRALQARDKNTPKTLEEGGDGHDNESLFVRSTRRVGYSLAAAAMLPAIFVQVPSGLSVNGSLVAGITSANQISGSATNGTTVVNSTTLSLGAPALNSIALNVGYSVIQVAIGITVGLFLSAILVYPLGKRRSGLFSF